MNKNVVLTICGILLIGIFFLALDMKNAFKVLPGNTSGKMRVPSFADWREYIPQSNKFKVSLPAVPQYAQETVSIPNTNQKRHYEMYIAEKLDGATFMISLITYPSDYNTTDNNGLLHSIVDEMVTTNPNNRLEGITDVKYLDRPAIDFKINSTDFTILGKAFMWNKTLCLLTYIAKKPQFNQDDYQHFIDSFKLQS